MTTRGGNTVILIAYDGSVDADAAIDRAAGLLRDQQATVLTVWERLIDVLERSGSAFAVGDIDYESVDREAEAQARRRGEDGARQAEQAGLKPKVEVRARDTSVADSILAAAEEFGADAILMGTRGLSGIKSVLMGSVSHAVLQHSDRPVIVVPSPEVAAERAGRRQ
jgi:nucleotide-binding universal stress UspA family protein